MATRLRFRPEIAFARLELAELLLEKLIPPYTNNQ